MTGYRVVCAEDLADEIVSRLNNLQIPASAGAFARRAAAHGEKWGLQTVIGANAESMLLQYKLMPDGRIVLQLLDYDSRPVWEAILRPPAETERDEVLMAQEAPACCNPCPHCPCYDDGPLPGARR